MSVSILVPGLTVTFEREGERQTGLIVTIDRCHRRGDSFGERVPSLPWADRDYAFLTLDTGFCFGTELV